MKDTLLTFDLASRNFAGVIGPPERISEIELKDWEKVMAVNTTGVFLCNKYQMRQMAKQESVEVCACHTSCCLFDN